jgi:hypothetical protein
MVKELYTLKLALDWTLPTGRKTQVTKISNLLIFLSAGVMLLASGSPPGDISLPPHDDKISHAARQTRADDFIRRLPRGYETVLGHEFEDRLPLDWSLLLEEVAFFRGQAPIFLMLNGLQQIFPETVPKGVLASLKRYRPSSLERLALSPIFGKGFSRLLRLYHHRRLSDWAAYLAAIFWPHPDYLVAVLGKPDRAAYLWRSLRKTLP